MECIYVMIPLPLKQGLKPYRKGNCQVLIDGYDSTSTKTRIETNKSVALLHLQGWL